MSFDYQSIENHVAMRDGLPSAIRPTLLEQTRSDWKDHPRFGGKAQFFMNIHRQLLDGTHDITRVAERLVDLPEAELSDAISKSNIVGAGRHLIQFAHGHHEIEDHGYFPQFARLYPNLGRALKLLDGDHKILDQALRGAQESLLKLSGSNITTDKIAALLNHMKALEKIMNRHIFDEEEIIIPIFLRHG